MKSAHEHVQLQQQKSMQIAQQFRPQELQEEDPFFGGEPFNPPIDMDQMEDVFNSPAQKRSNAGSRQIESGADEAENLEEVASISQIGLIQNAEKFEKELGRVISEKLREYHDSHKLASEIEKMKKINKIMGEKVNNKR